MGRMERILKMAGQGDSGRMDRILALSETMSPVIKPVPVRTARQETPAVRRNGSPDMTPDQGRAALLPYPVNARQGTNNMIARLETAQGREDKALDRLYKRDGESLTFMTKPETDLVDRGVGRYARQGIQAGQDRRAAEDEQRRDLSAGIDETLAGGQGAMMTPAQYEALNRATDNFAKNAPLSPGARVGLGVKSIGESFAGAIPRMFDAENAYSQELDVSARRMQNPDYIRYNSRHQSVLADLDYMRRNGETGTEEYKEAQEELKRLSAILAELSAAYAPALPDTYGAKMMDAAEESQARALEGLSPMGRFLGGAAISVGQNLALLPTAAISPALPLVGMGLTAGAQKTHEMNARGVRPEEALFRGAVSGGIEILTEKIPLEGMLDMVKTGGRGFIKNMLRQAGTEATEEGVSYVLNYLADKAARDPEASFSVAELLEQAAAGGLSGLFFGVAGTAMNAMTGGRKTGGQADVLQEIIDTAAEQKARQAAAADTLLQIGQNKTAPESGTAADTGVNTDLTGHTPAEQKTILEYQAATDPELAEFYDKAVAGEEKGSFPLKPVSQRMAEDTKRILGIDNSGFKIQFEARLMRDHINRRHGPEGRADRSMADTNDVARVQYVLDNYDYAEDGGQTDAYWETKANGKNRQAKTINFYKKVDGTYVVVQAVPVTKARSNYVVSVYMTKAGPSQLPVVDPRGTPSAHAPSENDATANNPAYEDNQLLSSRLQLPSAMADDILNNSIPQGPENRQGGTGTSAPGEVTLSLGNGPGASPPPEGGGDPPGGAPANSQGAPMPGDADAPQRPYEKPIPGDSDAPTEKEDNSPPTGPVHEYKGPGAAAEKLGVEVASPIVGTENAAILLDTEESRRQIEREARKAESRLSATEKEKEFARGIASGVFGLEDIPGSVRRGAVLELTDYYRAADSFKENGIAAAWKRTREGVEQEAFDDVVDFGEYTPPDGKFLRYNTPYRIFLKTFGEEKGQALYDKYFGSIAENGRRKTLFVNRMYDEVRQLGIKQGSEESADLQLLLEGKMEVWELPKETAGQIEAAYNHLKERYNDFYDLINDILVTHGYKPIGFTRDYAPHIQGDKMQQAGNILQRLGFADTVYELPASLAGRTDVFKPGKQYNPFFQQRTGDKTVLDAIAGYESYVSYMSNVVFKMDAIQRLRVLNNTIRAFYAPESVRSELDAIKKRGDWGSVESQEAFDAVLERNKELGKYGDFVTWLDDFTNKLAGKQTFKDRMKEKGDYKRKSLNFGNKLLSVFVNSTIPGNLSSAINQTVQLPQLITEAGERNVLKAMYDIGSGELGRSGFDMESAFIVGKQGVDALSERKGLDKYLDAASIPFEAVDDFSSRLIVRACYLKYISEGMGHQEAMTAADRAADMLVGSRMTGLKPMAFEDKNFASRLLHLFQLEIANGWNHYFQDMPREIKRVYRDKGKGAAIKRAARLYGMGAIYAYLANLLIKSITGREPAPFDWIGAIFNFLGRGFGMTGDEYRDAVLKGEGPEGFELNKAAPVLWDFAENNVPFLSNLDSIAGGRISEFAGGSGTSRLALPQIGNSQITRGLKGWFFPDEEASEEERAAAKQQAVNDLLAGVGKAAATWVPTGGQLKKTAEGAATMFAGGSYTGSGENRQLQYPVGDTPLDWARAILFGKSALPESRAYWDLDGRPLSAKQTKAAEEGVAAGGDLREIYDLITAQRGVEADKEQVGTKRVYKDGRITEEPVERVTESAKSKTLKGLKDSGLPEDVMLALYAGAFSTSDKRTDAARRLAQTGVSIRTFLDIERKYDAIDKGDGSAGDKATEFSKYLDRLGMDGFNRQVLDQTFSFGYYVPAEPEGYRLDLMSDAARAKWPAAEAMGYTEEQYVRLYRIFTQQKKKEEILKDAEGAGLSKEEAERFWSIVKGTGGQGKTGGLSLPEITLPELALPELTF